VNKKFGHLNIHISGLGQNTDQDQVKCQNNKIQLTTSATNNGQSMAYGIGKKQVCWLSFQISLLRLVAIEFVAKHKHRHIHRQANTDRQGPNTQWQQGGKQQASRMLLQLGAICASDTQVNCLGNYTWRTILQRQSGGENRKSGTHTTLIDL